jgi:hypothetical protein
MRHSSSILGEAGPTPADAVGAARIARHVLIRIRTRAVARHPSKPLPYATEAPAAADDRPDHSVATHLGVLVYELLDAHADTARLARELPYDQRWAAHLEYLQALQRKGREILAHSVSELSA